MTFHSMNDQLSNLFGACRKVCGILLVLSGFASNAMALVPSAPELNPGDMTSALALVTGGLLLYTARRRSK